MTIGLIGRKVGVTQVFQGDGTMVAVSVLEIEPNTVTLMIVDDIPQKTVGVSLLDALTGAELAILDRIEANISL